MATGLIALLDDVAGIAQLAAASLDDIGAAAAKAGTKAAGVVIDDTAVTPAYVTGFSPERELPIIARIAVGSLRNKLLILLPVAMLLSALAPWAMTPLLMIGGAFLCYEGAEKLWHAVAPHDHDHDGIADGTELAQSSAEVEREKVAGAVRTDFILSAEIMAIALASVADKPLLTQSVVLAIVGIAITLGVYGAVALIVKMDDVGLFLAQRRFGPMRGFGRALVKGVPVVLRALSVVGTAAMLWVGGGIVLHGGEGYGLTALPHAIADAATAARGILPALAGFGEWLVTAAASGIVGVAIGALIVATTHLVPRRVALATA